jgi:adenylate cyclase
MQDKITQKIVTALAVTLGSQDQDDLLQVKTSNSSAYDVFLQGWEHYRRATPEDFGIAVSRFEQAIELDPDYARAHSAMAAVHWNIVSNGWWYKSLGITAVQTIEQTRLYLAKALKHPSALAHQIASERAAYFRRSPDKALAEAEIAIKLDANDPSGHLAMAIALLKANRPAEAVKSVRTAMRLDPHYPASYLARLGQAQFLLGQYREAADTLERSIFRNSQDDRALIFLAAAYGQLGRTQDAKIAISSANALRVEIGWGDLTFDDIRNWKWVGDHEKLLEGLAVAGIKSGHAWMALITNSGASIEGATEVDVETAKQLFDFGIPFVDISRAYSQGHILGASSLMWYRGSFSQAIPREFNEVQVLEIVKKTQGVVVYESAGRNYAYGNVVSASAYLVGRGFQKVYYFRGDLDTWKASGYPVGTGK